MSSIYHTEPPTQGKVVLKTSYGDIDIELFSKECPLACRNFIQLCLEGYYDKSPIIRIIKGFMIQMGDPTGTGKGGESIWGRPFKDEIHGRIRFNHRGQVACVNENIANTNLSQFFITLAPCEWLNKKHTIFGKVTGNTIYNVLRMGEAETNSNDVPTEPIIFIKADVIWNPFDDIIPRDLHKLGIKSINSVEKVQSNVSSRKVSKNKNLLSFVEDDDTTFTKPTEVKLPKTSFNVSGEDQKEISDEDIVPSKERKESISTSLFDEIVGSESFDALMKAKMIQAKEKLEKFQVPGTINSQNLLKPPSEKYKETNHQQSTIISNVKISHDSMIEDKKREFDRLRDDLIRSKQAIKVLTGVEAAESNNNISKNEVVNELEQRRQKFIKRKKEYGDREQETLMKLQKFSHTLKNIKRQAPEEAATETKEAYHGQILEVDESIDDPKTLGNDWFLGRLKFKKHIDDKFRFKNDDYDIIDPRLNNNA